MCVEEEKFRLSVDVRGSKTSVLKVARNSFQHLYCDGSLSPLLII